MIHAITCHFNPNGYKRCEENYWRFRKALTCCPLHTIELSFTGRFKIPDAIHVRGGPSNVMWQKERLLNILVNALPSHIKKIAWIDSDILFLNPAWADEAEELLDDVAVVQLFNTAHYLNSVGQVGQIRKSFVQVLKDGVDSVSAPGFAWAARREVFPLLDINVIGGGDKAMAEGWRSNWNAVTKSMNKLWAKVYIDHLAQQNIIVQKKAGCVTGDIIHCWHGEFSKRNYTKRYKYLTDYFYDPEVDIRLGKNGLWEWSSNKPDMHKKVRDYFAERQEDG